MATRKTLATMMKNIVAEARKNRNTDYRPLVNVVSRRLSPHSPAQKRILQEARAALNALSRMPALKRTRAFVRRNRR
jgi:hypothetical protein